MVRLGVTLILILMGVWLFGCAQGTPTGGVGPSSSGTGAGTPAAPEAAETGAVPVEAAPPRAPVAVVRAIGPQNAGALGALSGVVPFTVQISGGDSWDPDGYILSYRWRFGDGADSAAADVTHTYVVPGRYSLTLSVVDDQGLTGVTTVLVSADTPGAPAERP